MKKLRTQQIGRLVKFIKKISKDDLGRIIALLQEIQNSDYSIQSIEKSFEQLRINAQSFIEHSMKLVADLKELVTDITNDYAMGFKPPQ